MEDILFFDNFLYFLSSDEISIPKKRIHKMCGLKFEHATEQVQHAASSLKNKLTLECPNLSR